MRSNYRRSQNDDFYSSRSIRTSTTQLAPQQSQTWLPTDERGELSSLKMRSLASAVSTSWQFDTDVSYREQSIFILSHHGSCVVVKAHTPSPWIMRCCESTYIQPHACTYRNCNKTIRLCIQRTRQTISHAGSLNHFQSEAFNQSCLLSAL